MSIEEEIKKYNTVWQDTGYRSLEASQGLKYVAKVCADIKFKSVLDVGCGPGWSVLEFMCRGYKSQGIEPSDYLFTQELRVPAGLGIVKKASITSIPHPADSFDLVFCTDVLEHIPEEEVPKAISELVRVSRKHIFCSICFHDAMCFPKLKLHCCVKPREWWDEQFARYKVKRKAYGKENEYLYVKF